MRVGVIGIGVVGGAVADSFAERGHEVARWDKYKPEHSNLDGVLLSEAIFVCVPTPTADGKQDIDPLCETLKLLADRKYEGAIAVKSTVLPGTTETLANLYGLTRLTHNPEFLTAATPFRDFNEQKAVLIGSRNLDAAYKIASVYADAGFANVSMAASGTLTELAKYFHNLFSATAISLSNEFEEVCATLGVEYSAVRQLACQMGRVPRALTQVPGPDGKRGFAGMCYPKDTQAFLSFAQALGLGMEVLEATVEGNKKRRPEE